MLNANLCNENDPPEVEAYLKFSVCSNASFDNSVRICFVTAPWLDCFCTFAALSKVGGTIADDMQISPPLALIAHVLQDCRGIHRGPPCYL